MTRGVACRSPAAIGHFRKAIGVDRRSRAASELALPHSSRDPLVAGFSDPKCAPLPYRRADNLRSLHEHEETLRAQSLEAIAAEPALTDHLNIISEAINLIYAFSHDYQHQDDDELTLRLLGIRLFNAAGASIKLALSGYYQKAFDQVRDLLDTYFLVDYLTTFRRRSRSGRRPTRRNALHTSAQTSSARHSISGTATTAGSEKGFTISSQNTHRTPRILVSLSC